MTVIKSLGRVECANCKAHIHLYQGTRVVCSVCGADFGLPMTIGDTVSRMLMPLVQEGQQIARRMRQMAADAQVRADLKDDSNWSRVAAACRHEADAFEWKVRALQERVAGGEEVDAEAMLLRKIADMMITLAQHWRTN